jgi:putative membrane protein
MSVPWLLAIVHLAGFAIGLGAVWARHRALQGKVDRGALQRALVADNWWALSAILLISTGILRAFVGFEKGADYYLGNHLFLTKLGLLVLILGLEGLPMVTLVRWRQALARGNEPELTHARTIARISLWQTVLLLIMLVMATGMARGFGAG